MNLATAKKEILKKYPDARPVQVLIGWTIWATTKDGYRRISDGCERVKYAWLNAAIKELEKKWKQYELESEK